MAACAARAGAGDDALRLWRRRMAIDPMDLGGIDDLVAAGLAKRLRVAYAQRIDTHPESIVAARAARAISAAGR